MTTGGRHVGADGGDKKGKNGKGKLLKEMTDFAGTETCITI